MSRPYSNLNGPPLFQRAFVSSCAFEPEPRVNWAQTYARAEPIGALVMLE